MRAIQVVIQIRCQDLTSIHFVIFSRESAKRKLLLNTCSALRDRHWVVLGDLGGFDRIKSQRIVLNVAVWSRPRKEKDPQQSKNCIGCHFQLRIKDLFTIFFMDMQHI